MASSLAEDKKKKKEKNKSWGCASESGLVTHKCIRESAHWLQWKTIKWKSLELCTYLQKPSNVSTATTVPLKCNKAVGNYSQPRHCLWNNPSSACRGVISGNYHLTASPLSHPWTLARKAHQGDRGGCCSCFHGVLSCLSVHLRLASLIVCWTYKQGRSKWMFGFHGALACMNASVSSTSLSCKLLHVTFVGYISLCMCMCVRK